MNKMENFLCGSCGFFKKMMALIKVLLGFCYNWSNWCLVLNRHCVYSNLQTGELRVV